MTTLKNNLDFGFLISHPAHFLALGFGAGLSPKAPGTMGTFVGFALYWLLSLFPPVVFWSALVVCFVVGVWASDKTGHDLGVSDHGAIVWDEVAAFALVLAFTPVSTAWYIVAFLLFRLFDITKPFPICYADRHVKGGFGVMLDDLLAAGYTILVLQIVSPLQQVF